MLKQKLEQDRAQAEAFLKALDPTASTWTFQIFDDNADREPKLPARTRTGTLEECWSWLCAANEQGLGVFVTIQETDGKGRKSENIIRIRAVFVDTDGAPQEPIAADNPHIIVESSPGNYHDYWRVDGCPLDELKPAQRDLIEIYGTDKSVTDLTRVMRLPGFFHQKVDLKKGLVGTPFMVKMVESTAHFPPDQWGFRKGKISEQLLAKQQAEPAHPLSLSERAAVRTPMQAGQTKGDGASRFWRSVNEAALADLDAWVPVLLPSAKKQATGGWRVTSHALGRDLEEDLSLHPDGIQDFGQENGLTAIDVVQRFRGVEARDAAMWLCEQLGVAPASLGWSERADITFSTPQPDPDPVDLWGSFNPPHLPAGLLPRIIADFACANGDQMGADPAGLAVAALVTCAAAIPDAIQIKVKRHADWCESARLWAALIGPPSAKKSPIISAATGPLCNLDVKMMRDWQARLTDYLALPKDERPGPPPPQTRLRIEDATVEAAQQVLEGSPWGVLLLQDELSGFFGAMDKYNGGKAAQADRAFWLRAFNGGQFALNRVGRGAAIIDNLSVSMLGGIQPEPIRKVAGDAVDDGLLQRLFPILLRKATIGRDEPMPPVNSEYHFLIEGLRNLRPPGFGGIGKLTFDDGAQTIRRELEAKHLDLQSMETVNRKLASHIGKLDGLFARLCVVWHCVEHIGQKAVDSDLPEIVTEATARRVADFLHGFLLPHAIGFYSGVLGLSDDHDRLTAIAGYILTHKVERITNRDVQRGDRTMRGLKDHEIRPLLEQLDALGWLERMEPPRPSSPPHWRVNPKVHAKFAERAAREAQRRQNARATIQRLVQQ